jgi:uncharacterized membrane protein
MRDFVITVVTLLVLALIALVATALVVASFIGVGAVFARFTELTLFEATIVVMPVGAAALYLFARLISLLPVGQADRAEERDEEDEGEDWDEDLEFEDLPPETRRKALEYLVERLEEVDSAEPEVQPRRARGRRRR